MTPTVPSSPEELYLSRKDVEYREFNARILSEFSDEGYALVRTDDLRRCLDSCNQDGYARHRLLNALSSAEKERQAHDNDLGPDCPVCTRYLWTPNERCSATHGKGSL